MGHRAGEVEGDLGLARSDFQLDFMISWLVLTTCLPLKTSQLPSIDLWHEDTELEVHRRHHGVDPSVDSGNRAQRGTAQPLVFQIDAKSILGLRKHVSVNVVSKPDGPGAMTLTR